MFSLPYHHPHMSSSLLLHTSSGQFDSRSRALTSKMSHIPPRASPTVFVPDLKRHVSTFAPAGSASNDGWRMCSVWWGSGGIRADVVPHPLVEVDREALCIPFQLQVDVVRFLEQSCFQSGFQQEFRIRGFSVEWGAIGRGVACKKGKAVLVLVCSNVKVKTVKDQSSHSIKANHRGPGSRLKVKAIKSKLIQDCQSELQEPRLMFKRPTRAMVNIQEAHKSHGQHSRGPQVTRGAHVQEASRRSA
ncbi:hypothetical protein B0F90DRAFT_1928779 [Multifurca ochricompacta]|uniref:Uncharacterized protein n=1 Tax=Multifurca ochricompacta TaxID=376703 RepID=A0AAD4LW36_9AGAM|nr:hypothetical protein B0F90DRAFT_1928779 [Multifurca ochricompacta]